MSYFECARLAQKSPRGVAARHSATKLGRMLIFAGCLLGLAAACSPQPSVPPWTAIEKKIYLEINELWADQAANGAWSVKLSQRWEQAALFRHLRAKGVISGEGKRWAAVESGVFDGTPDYADLFAYVQHRAKMGASAEVSAGLALTAMRAFVLELVAAVQNDDESSLVDANRYYSMLEGMDMVLRGYWQPGAAKPEDFRPPVDLNSPAGEALRDAMKLALAAAGLMIDARSGADFVSSSGASQAFKESLLILNDALAAAP